MSDAEHPVAPVQGTGPSHPRMRSLKRLAVISMSVGAGVVLALSALIGGVLWYQSRHRPPTPPATTPAKVWPEMDVPEGLRASLKTTWKTSEVLYQFRAWPQSPELSAAFEREVNRTGGVFDRLSESIVFSVLFNDKDGFLLCEGNLEITRESNESGRIGALTGNGSVNSCSWEQYNQAATWNLKYKFPKLQAAKPPSGQSKRQGPTDTPPEDFDPIIEQPDEFAHFDGVADTLTTASGTQFSVSAGSSDRMTLIQWGVAPAKPPLKYSCYSRTDCVIENRWNGRTIQATLLKRALSTP